MRIIRLTEKGIKVADLLIQADKILSEDQGKHYIH